MIQTSTPRALLAAALLLGCRSPAPGGPKPAASQPASSQPAEADMKMNKRPPPPVRYLAGPALEPAEPLLDWLRREGEARPRRKLKIPAVIHFRDEHRIGLGEAFIGVEDPAPKEAIYLDLDDSALGISLLDRVRQRCPEPARSCALWLVGYWGPGALPLPAPPDDGRTRWPFSVLELPEAEALERRVFIEQPTPAP